MKNKGFTLIELLAVLVLLAVISVITIPNVLTSLNNTKEQTLLRSADNLIKTAELKFLDSIFQGYHSTYEEGILTSGEELSFKGKTPDYLAINVNDEGRVSIAIWDNSINKCVVKGYNDNETRFEAAADYVECMSYAGTTIVVLFTQVTDTNPGVICSATETEDYANNSTCYIRSIEDLVQLSELAKTNNFSTKTIYLEANLDFENDLSYVNPNTTVFGDINGNSIIEPLKTELTTSAGFYPIGGTISFYGNLNGNGNQIKRLYINRPSMTSVGFIGVKYTGTTENFNIVDASITGLDNVGFIGYAMSNSITKGINIISSNVSGRDSVGLLAGRSYQSGATLNTNYIDGNVNGNNYVGGAIGYINSLSTFINAVVSANVSGNSYVGGVVGYNNNSFYNIIYKSGSVTSVDTVNVGRVNGYGTTGTVYVNDAILVNGVAITDNPAAKDGIGISISRMDNLSFYNGLFDTYIGGDDDADGYFFDYVNSGEIVTIKPNVNITLSGTGTVLDPYLLYNADDFRQASYQLNKSYKIMENIDFDGEKFYPFGTKTITFTGNIDGNGKTLSNLVIHGINNIGFIGERATGTTENLNIDNITITGFDNVGFIGYAKIDSVTKGINITNANVSGRDAVGILAGRSYQIGTMLNTNYVSGSVLGNNYVGGAVGYVNSSSTLSNIVVDAIVSGNSYVGGVVGYKTGTVSNVIYSTGSVSSVDLVNVGRVTGYGAPGNSYANSEILVNDETVTGITSTINGQEVLYERINTISFYNGVVDSYIGGDDDANGYFYDYDSNDKIVTMKPNITITLSGTGTQLDPYLLYNESDFKQAAYQLNKYYKVMEDINFSGDKFYPFGTLTTNFTGGIDGNGKTLSNLIIHGINKSGFIGSLGGSLVENLNIDNITITGFDNVGFVGYAMINSITRGINITNANVSGRDNVGILAGRALQTGTNFNNNFVSGNVSGNNYVGGAVGYSSSLVSVSYIVVDAIVNGNNYVGGVMGLNEGSLHRVFLFNGDIDTISTLNIGRVLGSGSISNAFSNVNNLLNDNIVTGTSSSLNGQDKTPAELLLDSTYTSVGFNFTNTTPDTYIWRISGSDIWVERN
jgi:prepilin-type N-terminal cleavage/methylation domain-containing protein